MRSPLRFPARLSTRRLAAAIIGAALGLAVASPGAAATTPAKKPAPKPAPVAPTLAPAPPPKPVVPRAIVFFLGDGMGMSHITLARNAVAGLGHRLAFESLPVTGLVSTWSTSNAVTDSSAAVTAFADGTKTANHYLGVDKSQWKVRSISELAQAAGWRVGYVTTTRITHATPAGYYAHSTDRNDEMGIALQLLAERPDVALGGGLREFRSKARGGLRKDGRDLVDEAAKAGFNVLLPGTPLAVASDGPVLGLFGVDHLAYVLDVKGNVAMEKPPSLAEMTRFAMDRLGRDGKPFFLMVEGGRIDHAAHDFDAAGVVAETAAFDDAVSIALGAQKNHPDLLVLVTADHSTGGLAINDYSKWEALPKHTASLAWLVARIRTGDGGVPLVAEKTGVTLKPGELEPVKKAADDYEAARALGKALSERDGFTWLPRVVVAETEGHTGEDVPIYAGGPGAERFGGAIDNTEIAIRLAALLGWKLPAPF